MAPDWNLKEWLEALAYLAAILVPVITGLVFLARKRRHDTESLTQALARSWTNEGGISSDEPFLLHLDLGAIPR